MFFHLAAEGLETAVDVDPLAALGTDKVYGTDGVVERQCGEMWVGRSPYAFEVVNLHPGVEAAPVAVVAAYALHLVEVTWHVGLPHVAWRLDGKGAVGSESVVGEAVGHRPAGERLHLGAPVAEFGM